MSTFYLYRKAWRFDGAPHQEPKLTKEEGKKLLKQGGLLVRNTYDFDCPEETRFWNLIKDHFGGMEELSGNTRKKVRRSLEKLDFKHIDIDLIEQEGFPILKATYKDLMIDTYLRYLLIGGQNLIELYAVLLHDSGNLLIGHAGLECLIKIRIYHSHQLVALRYHY